MLPQPPFFYLACAAKSKPNRSRFGLVALTEVRLLHHRQRQIIPVAAFVVGLEGVTADRNGRAIG